jgi:glycogen debranching enzyme
MKHLKQFTQFVNENVDSGQLKELEKYADGLFNELGLDVVFTKHFKDRVNDIRNGQPITYNELKALFLKAYLRAGEQISELPVETEAVLKDLSSNLNAPFKIQDAPDDAGHTENDMVMKTIMKKERFMSSNQTIEV